MQLLWFSYVSCWLQSGPPEFLRNIWSVNWHCPRRKEVSSYLEKTHPSSILWDMKRKCCLGELSSALEGMWRIYSESKGCSLMSESSSIWLHLQRATLSNIVAKLYLLLNASETKLLSKPQKKKKSVIHTLVYPVTYTYKKDFSGLFAKEFGCHHSYIKLKNCDP